ncbi:acyclic terpene utilization AtuA family protein [Chelatococcus reniformis]|uniref:Terpene utilization protein AtuA n=1 Tax=Chelatococcus reniformis TaxID=1494448 RepID=A0A916UC05_9HYPH|nr:acyclic terpene utilization AtuA family protein [Chelatococcus reniformis]GGC68063.1 hypothetical protein GCM10010994_28280 [Chelatococcus reniformis]
MSAKTIRIGGASGFWGDTAISTPQLLKGGDLDYLVFDYLAEITMSIMARARAKDPSAGYAHDFVGAIARELRTLSEKKIKVIANAGGVNPVACARALEAKIAEAGYDLKVGVVVGDDLLGRADEFKATKEMYSGQPMPAKLWSMNAYLGGRPIAAALDAGADIVITGRCVDSAVTLGAAIHAFGWTERDLDQLAGASLAGHIIECGAQATGGLHTDWETTGDWSNIGYPVAEVAADGSFVVSKPAGTGGLISFATVAEQMLYEIGDPRAYLLPDVTCDFTQVRIEEVGPDLVKVSNAKGLPATDSYKVSATYQDGFRVGMYITIGGLDAARKAEKVADSVIRRCEAIYKSTNLPPFTETSVEVIGAEASYGPHSRARAAREVILKVAAKHPDAKALEILVRELTSSGTSMSPGISGMGGNRPKVMPVVRLFSCLVDKHAVQTTVEVAGKAVAAAESVAGGFDPASLGVDAAGAAAQAPAGAPVVPLIALAWGRSGDKGDKANIGVIARKPAYLPYIRAALTANAVAAFFGHHLKGGVERFELPGTHALNFLLHDVLGGGGIASLRNDPQAKAFAQMLMDYPVPVTPEIAAAVADVAERFPAAAA